MKRDRDLEQQLHAIDRRGYPAYKSLRGIYDFGSFALSCDRVQGDPFASPSQFSVYVPADGARLPQMCISAAHRRVASADALVRRLAATLRRMSHAVGGSGKSGYLGTSAPGPEVLARSACEVSSAGEVIARFEVGLPARGRSIDGRAAARMLLDLVPGCIERALMLDEEARQNLVRAAQLADDQRAVRAALIERGLVAFVADGSVLPRASGISSRPLAGARPFRAPGELRVTLDLPHRGKVSGMGVPRGVTLIVGGGFHGKSTLLKALQEGVYDHVAGDGRELVITDAAAVKLRAEDGRLVREVDISPFITGLPDGRDTSSFTTEDASGSTSQAAATMEALEAGARVLLIDEDTSATNFMVRDELMEAVVAPDHEPIIPFVERVRELWEGAGVSSVLVVGSSGSYFTVADTVVQMDAYEAYDITARVRRVLARRGVSQAGERISRAACDATTLMPAPRPIALRALPQRSRGAQRGSSARGERVKVRARGLEGFSVGGAEADVRLVEQLVDAEQVAALAQLTRLVFERGLLCGGASLAEVVDELERRLDEEGWEALAVSGPTASGLALPRRQEIFAALNRLRLG